MLQTTRRSIIVAFWAFLLFALAFIALGRITDPRSPFEAVAQVHQDVNVAFTGLAYSGYLVLLVVVLGGLPLLFNAFRTALIHKTGFAIFRLRAKHLLWLLAGAFGCAVLLVGTIIGTELLFGTSPSSGGQPATPLGWLLSGLALVGGMTLGIFVLFLLAALLSAVVARSVFGEKLLVFALVAIAVCVLGMGVTTVATTVWIARFWQDAPQVALNSDALGRVGLSWVVVVILAMLVATIVALLANWQGWRARVSRAVLA